MFTGIIETVGEIVQITHTENILSLLVRSEISSQLRPEQSVAHDGVCLTVVERKDDTHKVELVQETLYRSHFKNIAPGTRVNLERAMPATGRFEGHIVQGHVDGVGQLISINDGIYTFHHPSQYAKFLIEKGSVCINGVSLTIATLAKDTFGVAIIPYTQSHTNFDGMNPGAFVNLEFDILAKHLARLMELYGLKP